MEEKESKFRKISNISNFERTKIRKKLEKVDGGSGKLEKSQGKVREFCAKLLEWVYTEKMKYYHQYHYSPRIYTPN